MNRVTILGNLTRDIELRYAQSGTPIANFGVATSEKWKDKNTGEQREEVMFIDVTVFGKSAEIVNQYFSKGKKILIEGKLKLESWVDTNNNKRSKHTVKCEAFYFVESKGTSGNQAQQYAQPQQYHNGVQYEVQQSPQQHQGQPQGNQPSFTIEDDDIPF